MGFLKDTFKSIRNIPVWRRRKSSFSFVNQKQWADSNQLTDELYDELYERNGLTHKLINRLGDDIYNKWVNLQTEDDQFREQAELLASNKPGGLDFKAQFRKARKLAMRHGYALVFMTYVDGGEDIGDPVKNPRLIENLRVIRKPDVRRIELEKDSNSLNFGQIKYYWLNPGVFEGQATEFKLHASRVIRFANDPDYEYPESISMIKPMYNWIDLFDDISWSIGQAYFRYGTGFPVLKIKNYETMPTAQREELENQWKNVNSMTGWIHGEDDEIRFEGAQGRALNPKEYFEVALLLISVSSDISYTLLAGVNAGAITGSETNTKDYFSQISNKQTEEEQPLIDEFFGKLIETGQLPDSEYDIIWNPLEEITEKERSETDKVKAETNEILNRSGLMTKDYSDMIEDGELVEVEKISPQNQFPNTTLEPQTPGAQQLPKVPLIGDAKKIVLERPNQLKSKFDAPKYRKMEREYLKQLSEIFKDIQDESLILVSKTFRDSKDAINEEDYKRLTQEINRVFTVNGKKFKPIVNKNIALSVMEGGISAGEELNIPLKIPKSGLRTKTNVVATEHLGVVNGIADDISKDITTQLGIVTLNPSLTGRQIEKLIRDSFSKKISRLEMGVINEVNNGLNQGNLLGYEESGIVVGKEWVAVVDDVTTNTCLALNGEVVAIGEAFSTGDYAPPAAEPPHPCRSSLRSVSASEAGTIGLKFNTT